MRKKIWFILFFSIGNVVGSILIYYLFESVNVPVFIALYTSILTATYQILAEPTKRTDPFLRINPKLSDQGMDAGLDILIENIGYSIAKDIEVKCKLVPGGSLPLIDNGVFKYSSLAPRETPVKYSALVLVKDSELLSQEKLIIEVSYLNEDGKKQKPIKMERIISKLQEEREREYVLGNDTR
jgi:hypothetical protein